MANDKVTKRIVVMNEEDTSRAPDIDMGMVRDDLSHISGSVDSLVSSFGKFAEMMQAVIENMAAVERGSEAHAKKAKASADSAQKSAGSAKFYADSVDSKIASATERIQSETKAAIANLDLTQSKALSGYGFFKKDKDGNYIRDAEDIANAAKFVGVMDTAGDVVGDLQGITKGVTNADVGSITKGVSSLLTMAGLPEAAMVVDAVGSIYNTAAGVFDQITDINKMGQRVTNLTGTSDIGQEIAARWGAELGRFDIRASKQDYQTIQGALRGARADYHSSLYNEGLEWSLSTMENYGLDAKTASDMFVSSVIKGGASAEALSAQLDLLMQSVKDGEQTMDDAVKQMKTWTANLKTLGGSTEYQSAIGAGLSEAILQAGGSQETLAMVTKVVGQWGSDYTFQSDVNRYMAAGDSYEEALIAASRDWATMTNIGFEGAGAGYAILHEVQSDGRSIMDMIKSGDVASVEKYSQSDAHIQQALRDYAGYFGIDGQGADKSTHGIIAGLTQAVTGFGDAGERYGSIDSDRRSGSISVNGVEVRVILDKYMVLDGLQSAADQRNSDRCGNG